MTKKADRFRRKARAPHNLLHSALTGERISTPPTSFIVRVSPYGTWEVSITTMHGSVEHSRVRVRSLDEFKRFMRKKSADAGVKVRSLKVRYHEITPYTTDRLDKINAVLAQLRGAFE